MDKHARMATLQEQIRRCQACPNIATRRRVVCGEGNVEARIVLVGQGPGAVEEETGRPFVGPAGMLLDRVLAEAGLQREALWITNLIKCRATKRERGRLVDRSPSAAEIKACRPWLEEELELIQPQIVVCIGTPAAQALIDKKFKMNEDHGQFRTDAHGRRLLATFHPAYVLRLRSVDQAAYERVERALVADLKKVAAAVEETA
ncbi:MAG: uracil-DNA glycosylase [Candidatus Binatia bacterium]|nr:uracil-DNA glycosylase [Candidatus Binatia bacterium]